MAFRSATLSQYTLPPPPRPFSVIHDRHQASGCRRRTMTSLWSVGHRTAPHHASPKLVCEHADQQSGTEWHGGHSPHPLRCSRARLSRWRPLCTCAIRPPRPPSQSTWAVASRQTPYPLRPAAGAGREGWQGGLARGAASAGPACLSGPPARPSCVLACRLTTAGQTPSPSHAVSAPFRRPVSPPWPRRKRGRGAVAANHTCGPRRSSGANSRGSSASSSGRSVRVGTHDAPPAPCHPPISPTACLPTHPPLTQAWLRETREALRIPSEPQNLLGLSSAASWRARERRGSPSWGASSPVGDGNLMRRVTTA